VVFPGGFGTLDELFEALTLVQCGRVHDRPVVLVGRDYWMGLIAWLEERLEAEGKIDSRDARLLRVTDDPEEVVSVVCAAVGDHGSGRKT
jgi:uncharacterized protein (TIGR00730 family)